MGPLSIGLRAKPISLDARAMAAVKRSGGVVHLPGAATPVLGPNLVTTPLWTGPAIGGAAFNVQAVTPGGVLVVGKNYLLSATVSGYTGSGTVGFSSAEWGGNSAAQISSNGVISAVVSGSTTNPAYVFTRSTNTCTLSNIRLEEVTGYTYGNPPVRNYLDSAGTDILDSVTQFDQPAGLTLDAVGVVGPNVFSDAAVTFGGESTRVSPGVYRIYSSAGVFSNMTVTSGAWINKTYKLRFYQDTSVSGVLAVDGPAGAVVSAFPSGVGWKECIVTMGASASISIKRSSGVTDIQISNVTIEELTGNHATQPTTGSKPTLRRGIPNWLTQSDVSQWSFVNASGAATRVGNQVTFGASAVDRVLRSGNVTTAIGQTLTVAAKLSGTGSIRAIFLEGNGGTTTAVGNIELTATPTYYVFPVTSTTAGTSGGMGIYNNATGTAGALFTVHEAGVLNGTVTAQQIIDAGGIPLTTTAPASSARGSAWWQFDTAAPGDYLGMGIQTGETGWIAAAVTFGAAATANETIFANGAGSANLKGVWLLRNGGSGEHVMRMGVGNGVALDMVSAFALPIRNVPRVVEGGWDASSVFVGVDGNVVTAARSGSATPAPNTPMIGAYSPGNHHLNGALHAQVICPVVPPAQDRNLILRWLASRQGRRL